MQEFLNTSIKEGHIEKTVSFKHTYFDDDLNDEVCVEYATKEEALEELDYLHEDEDFEDLIDIQTVYKLTQEGLCHVNATKFSPI